MSDTAKLDAALFPEGDAQEPRRAPGQTHATGILPAHGIADMLREKQIWASGGVVDDQIQPASLDLRLGENRLSDTRQLSARRVGAGGR